MEKPSIPQGTRDFGPSQVARRQHIFGVIRRTFEQFGYAPIETPTLENLSVLTGKYGDEGDQLLFKVLNSGNFLVKERRGEITPNVTPEDLAAGPRTVLPKIAEKGLRYDLTVPFARYVAMNRHTLAFPFKRYQMQPVWRADRPQRGRYREFWQCDADVVGTDSLLCEAEIVLMMAQVLNGLGLVNFTIKINHRGILRGIYEALGEGSGSETDLLVAIDKLDKIGLAGVKVELAEKGFSENNLLILDRKLELLRNYFVKQGVQTMKSDTYDAHIALVNRIDYAVVRGSPHAIWFSTAGLVGDAAGRFQDFGEVHGKMTRLRQGDGIHCPTMVPCS